MHFWVMASGTGNEAHEQLFLTTYHMWGSSPDFSLILPSPCELGGLWHGSAFPLDSELTNSPKQECALLPASSLLWSKGVWEKERRPCLSAAFLCPFAVKFNSRFPRGISLVVRLSRWLWVKFDSTKFPCRWRIRWLQHLANTELWHKNCSLPSFSSTF